MPSKTPKECFSCTHKKSYPLTPAEMLKAIKDQAKDGKNLPIPNQGYKCNLSGLTISQLDPACEHYEFKNLSWGKTKS